jgi:hypothetical protein
MEKIELSLSKTVFDELEEKASQQGISLHQYLVAQINKLLATSTEEIMTPTLNPSSTEAVARLKAELDKSNDNCIDFEYQGYTVSVFSSFPTIIVSKEEEVYHFPPVVIDEIAKTFEEAVENAKKFIDNQEY